MAFSPKTDSPSLPTIHQALLSGFRSFNRWYLRKHFHTVAVNRQTILPAPFQLDDSLVLYANHASWWDPLAAFLLAEAVFPGFRMYAPIDKAAFEKYRVFGKMGFFPVDQTSLQGAKEFLRISRDILLSPGASLWITPEGRFVDVREVSACFMPGLSHLASSLASPSRQEVDGRRPQVWFVPAALEYTYWEERLPELLVWLGEPTCVTSIDGGSRENNSKQHMNETLLSRLRAAQQQLATAAQRRDAASFEVFLRSSGSTFFIYDWMRRVRCLLTGRRFEPNHSEIFSERQT